MDVDRLTSELQFLSAASGKIHEFEKNANELRGEIAEWSNIKGTLLTCAKVNSDLEEERRGHAEELRQINQDINQLEDNLKTLKQQRESGREALLRHLHDFKIVIEEANHFIKELCLDDESLLFRLNDDIPHEILESLNPAKPEATPPSSLFFASPLLSLPFLLQQTLKSTAPLQPDGAKMKICDSCQASIHRNAPTCPMCKARSRSKNPKRRRPAPLPLAPPRVS